MNGAPDGTPTENLISWRKILSPFNSDMRLLFGYRAMNQSIVMTGRELDLQVARALGLEVIDRETAVRLSNEYNDRQPKVFYGTTELTRSPWDGWYAHDWYVNDRSAVERTIFCGYNPVERYSGDLDASLTALTAMPGINYLKLTRDASGWSVNVNGRTLSQFNERAAESVCHAITKWREIGIGFRVSGDE